jgi:DNA end-binding protein Ku
MSNTPGRSIWNGSIAFGMVVVPVKLYTATDDHSIAFRQVHREDGGRIQMRRVCSIDGTEIPFADVAKGYELPDGQVLVLTDDDMAELPLPTAKTIEVLRFISPDIDPVMYSKSYYVLPNGPGSDTAYALLCAAMQRNGTVALVKVALRQRESLGLLAERDGALSLLLLLWPDEVREPPKPEPAANLSPALVDQAAALVDAMAGDFVPDEYTDRYAEALNDLVAAKIGGAAPVAPARPDAGVPVDLADALKASVAAAKGKRGKKS